MARNAYRRGRVRPRGTCPRCGRDVALLADGVVGTWHRKWLPDGPKCSGRGEKALPLPVEES